MRRSKPGLRFLYSYSSRNSSGFSALEPDIAPETAVLRRRPPKTLLEHPPKRKTFYMLLSRRKLSKCMKLPSMTFLVVGFSGLHKTTKKSAAELRYMTFEAQNFLLNKDTRLCTLLTFGRCGDMASSGRLCRTVDTKIVFQAKRPCSCLSSIF